MWFEVILNFISRIILKSMSFYFVFFFFLMKIVNGIMRINDDVDFLNRWKTACAGKSLLKSKTNDVDKQSIWKLNRGNGAIYEAIYFASSKLSQKLVAKFKFSALNVHRIYSPQAHIVNHNLIFVWTDVSRVFFWCFARLFSFAHFKPKWI